MLTDAHCHLDQGTWGAELPGVIARAEAAGVGRLIAVGIGRGMAGGREAQQLAVDQPNIWAAVGIHPHDAHLASEQHMVELGQLLGAEKVVALGEVGLDYHYDAATAPRQQTLLGRFCHMAAAHAQPLMLHIRQAHDDAIQILDDAGLGPRGGMVHCFTAGPSEAEAYLSRGMMLSIPGVVTFKNPEQLQEAVAMIPDDRLLVETDSPYLAPVPHRGRRNEPAYVAVTAAHVASLRKQTPQHVARVTTANAAKFFRLPTPPA